MFRQTCRSEPPGMAVHSRAEIARYRLNKMERNTMHRNMHDTFRPMYWKGGRLHLLDQRLLPHEEHWLAYDNAFSVAEAIRDMVVRGAPAIGITAAYAVV